MNWKSSTSNSRAVSGSLTIIVVMAGLVPRVSGSQSARPLTTDSTASPRHGRTCSGHPRLVLGLRKTWMAVTSTAMTISGCYRAVLLQPFSLNRTLVGSSRPSTSCLRHNRRGCPEQVRTSPGMTTHSLAQPFRKTLLSRRRDMARLVRNVCWKSCSCSSIARTSTAVHSSMR
jgi:hypothetical protein